MISYESQRTSIVAGLKAYLDCPVIRSNQNAPLPTYPFVSYTVTTVMSANKGTYGEHDDGKARKGVTQTWSISALSNDNSESVELANKAREWLDYVGTTYLNDNNVVVQSVAGITNRDNVLTSEYEYKNGFDVVFWLYDEIIIDPNVTGWIEDVEINEIQVHGKTYEEIIAELTQQLDAAETQISTLSAEVVVKDTQITNLNEQVAGLTNEMSRLSDKLDTRLRGES